MKYESALVIGAGAFGTAIAQVLSNNFKHIFVKVRSQDIYDGLLKDKENKVYLPGKKLNANIIPVLSWKEFDEKAKNHQIQIIISGLPTAAIRPYLQENKVQLSKYLKAGIPVVNLAKGIDIETLELPSDLFFSVFPDYKENFLFLSGPSFANEILDEQVTLVSLAGLSTEHLENVMKMMQTDYFKALATYDVMGLQLGGALKNTLAIASGIIEGLGYNHNTRAAMITRGIVEMLRFGEAFNAKPETFYGLSGMGDLILTTSGGMSRNKLFGYEIAKGRKPMDIINSQRSVVEGYKTTAAAYQLAKKFNIRSRMICGLYEVLYEDRDPKDVLVEIMRQPSKFE
ncbi:MAG: NAD(P)-dependent glycerol-3-phosphate dehydrogenase [Bacteriovoracaceae bacterium]|nr:NAD(P)-dependent glycerol-3-phosphate dehydrogenase [Bacteriovoracaceae bacterium]